MKKILVLIFLPLFLATFWVTELEAAPMALPLRQEALVVITSPRDNATVRGRVVITGSAFLPDFWKYEVHYASEPGGQWIMVEHIHKVPVINGQLAVWDTTLVPDGRYSLRLRVVHRDGNYEEYFVRGISVVNTQPPETPTPTPTSTPTPLPPTPTIVIEQPAPLPTSTPTPTPSVTVIPRPTSSIALSTIDVGDLGKAFLYGAGAAGGLFLLVGFLILLRQLIIKLLF